MAGGLAGGRSFQTGAAGTRTTRGFRRRCVPGCLPTARLGAAGNRHFILRLSAESPPPGGLSLAGPHSLHATQGWLALVCPCCMADVFRPARDITTCDQRLALLPRSTDRYITIPVRAGLYYRTGTRRTLLPARALMKAFDVRMGDHFVQPKRYDFGLDPFAVGTCP